MDERHIAYFLGRAKLENLVPNTIFFPKTVTRYFPSTRIPVAIQIGGFKDNFSIDCFQEMTFHGIKDQKIVMLIWS